MRDGTDGMAAFSRQTEQSVVIIQDTLGGNLAVPCKVQ